MAANVATKHTTKELYIGLMKLNVKGKKNNNNPATLFKMLCMDIIFLLKSNSKTMLPILMIATIIIQVHNQTGNCINGSIFTKHTVTNTLSATVSNLAPNSLVDFVILAIVPSIISVIPQNKYMM